MFYSHCGNLAVAREKTFGRRNSSWFSFWNKEERSTWLTKLVGMTELKDQVCKSWFAPVGSASDYPFLSKWVIYGEVLPLTVPLSHISYLIWWRILCCCRLFSFFLLNFYLSVNVQRIMCRIVKWNFSAIFIVGHFYWPLHCKLCCGKVIRVSSSNICLHSRIPFLVVSFETAAKMQILRYHFGVCCTGSNCENVVAVQELLSEQFLRLIYKTNENIEFLLDYTC